MKTFTPELESHREAFLESRRVKNYSPATISSYGVALKFFFRFLESRGVEDVREVTGETLRAYHLEMRGKNHSPATCNTYLRGVRRFFEWLEAGDMVLLNPCADLPPESRSQSLPRRILSHREVRAVLETPDLDLPLGVRDRGLLELFYSTGIRLAEMANLSIHDVDVRQGMLRVHKGKGGKDRVTPIGSTACQYLDRYLKIRGAWRSPSTALWLRVTRPHSPITRWHVAAIVAYCGKQAGLTLSAHVWRHTCATHLVSRGANIVYVQQLLGHQSLHTTQIYTRVTAREIAATHRKAHPRAGKK